jgi:hypothetical protein
LGVSLRTIQRREKGEIAISNEAMIALFELVRSPRYEVLRRMAGANPKLLAHWQPLHKPWLKELKTLGE